MADRRASDGVRLHTLRVKKANDDLWNKFFSQANIRSNFSTLAIYKDKITLF
jgi:hypothetical protein